MLKKLLKAIQNVINTEFLRRLEEVMSKSFFLEKTRKNTLGQENLNLFLLSI